jgi:hypothetical protein
LLTAIGLAVLDMQPIRDQRIHVVVDPALAETFITANYELLVLALRDLDENAVHHMPRGGSVGWLVKHDSGNRNIACRPALKGHRNAWMEGRP